jgi:hypothetical protein
VAGPQSSPITKCGAIFAATRGAGANFLHLGVARCSKIPDIRRPSLLELRKLATSAARGKVNNRLSGGRGMTPGTWSVHGRRFVSRLPR